MVLSAERAAAAAAFVVVEGPSWQTLPTAGAAPDGAEAAWKTWEEVGDAQTGAEAAWKT